MTEYQIHLNRRRGELRNQIADLMARVPQYREEAWRDMYLRKADKLTRELVDVERSIEKENSRY